MAEKRMTDTERLERIKQGLKCSDEEAANILAYDKAVDKGEKTEFDLSADKVKVAQKHTHAGTRKAPTAYKFTKRQRKPNATKAGIVAELAEFLEKISRFDVAEISVVNAERQIAFAIGGDKFELTLVQKRKPKQ